MTEAKAEPRTPTKRVGDVLPSGDPYPDLPKRELSDLLDQDMVIHDFAFLNGRYGRFAILKCRLPDSDAMFSTACGGEVVCRKLDDLREKRLLPIVGAISYNERYYDLA